MSLPTPERLSDLIGSIYDCVVAPEKWVLTLSEIIDELDFTTGALTVHDVATGNMIVHVTAGMDQEWLELTAEHTASAYDLWGGPETFSQAPREEPILLSELTPRSSWRGNAYFEAVGRPRRMHDGVAIALVRDSRTFGVVGLGRHERAGEIGEPVRSGLRLIAPHLRRAVTIGRLFEQRAEATATFSEVLEGIAAGAVLVDEGLCIVHANAAARTMLADCDPIRSREGRLSVSGPMAMALLVDAVKTAARNEAAMDRRSVEIPVREVDGRPAVIQVLPLGRRLLDAGVEHRTVAAVFISKAADPPRLPGDALAMIYNLTPAEARVFELIVEGKTPADVAALLSLKLSTVRTHLSRVFAKTGCARQADLIALASKVTLTV